MFSACFDNPPLRKWFGRHAFVMPFPSDAGLAADKLAAQVDEVGKTNVADGLWMDAQQRLMITAPEDNALKLRHPDGKLSVLARDRRLRWPDSLAAGANGEVYVTTSHIQDMPWYKGRESGPTPSEIWKLSAKQ